jgi:type VI secretion system protein ImpG
MEPRFLEYYRRELGHLRDMGAEFAREFPKIARRLGLGTAECEDPYVERLLEGFAFLAARVQLKLDASFPQFTQHMLELLYPGYLAPTPSMMVVQFHPNTREGALANGVEVPRGTSLRSRLGQNQTACDYRTAHAVTLLPLEIVSADYRALPSERRDLSLANIPNAKACLKIRLRTTNAKTFEQLRLEHLPIYLRGADLGPRLYEHLLSANSGFAVTQEDASLEPLHVHSGPALKTLGFEDENALLPCGARGFHGQRLLHEYFAFPERFLFVDLIDLAPGVRRCGANTVDINLFFSDVERRLEGVVKESNFALFCTPAINLFPRTSDRVALGERDHEYHVVPDRTRPRDYEVHSITRVVARGGPGQPDRLFLPMYAPGAGEQDTSSHFTLRRQPRMTAAQDAAAASAGYVPCEAYLSLVDGTAGPFDRGLRQLAIDSLCTNRALPLTMGLGQGNSDFTEQSGAPIEAVRCVAGPTPPRHSQVHGDLAWKLLSHLSLDYLTLTRDEPDRSALREMLGLYAGFSNWQEARKQIDGVLSVGAKNVIQPLPFPGPLTFGRGTEVTLTCNENGFEGTGAFLFASVMERFFAKYASINSFTQTVLRTSQRGEVMRWPTTVGRRNLM